MSEEGLGLPVCPACESEIPLDDMDVDKGEIIGCLECGVDLLVTNVCPIELELVLGDEGEWEKF